MTDNKETKQMFTFYGKLPSMNDLVNSNRANKFMGAKLKRESTEAVYWQAKEQNIKHMEVKSIVTFRFYEASNRRDDDNVISGMKFLLDGLVKADVFNDDSRKYVSVRVLEVLVDKDNPRVEVEIEEI